jgi:hypothetical protein
MRLSAGLLVLATLPLHAAEPPAAMMQVPAVEDAAQIPTVFLAPAPPQVSAETLPPMNYSASVAANELFEKIKAVPAFARVDKELAGSPIQLRVTHSLQPTAGGQATGLLSAIWAGSTLGLLPVVTNNSLVLTYEVRVNGKEILHQEFQRSFTRAVNIWTEQSDPTYGLGQDGLAWAVSTATEFATNAAQDPSLLALAQEYAFYFGAATP